MESKEKELRNTPKPKFKIGERVVVNGIRGIFEAILKGMSGSFYNNNEYIYTYALYRLEDDTVVGEGAWFYEHNMIPIKEQDYEYNAKLVTEYQQTRCLYQRERDEEYKIVRDSFK